MTTYTTPLLDPSAIRSTPDWRYRWLAGKPHLVNSDAPISPEELPDTVLREVLTPYIRRLNYYQAEMGEREYEVMRMAYSAYTNKAGSNMAANMEARALAGATESGEYGLVPCQRIYEAVFFDVRHCLGDVEMMVDLVFEPLSRNILSVPVDFAGKVVAYTLGVEHHRRWMNNDRTPEVIALERRLEDLEAFRRSLEALGLSSRGAWSKALCRLLRSVLDGGGGKDEDGFLKRPGWQRRLAEMIDSTLAAVSPNITREKEVESEKNSFDSVRK